MPLAHQRREEVHTIARRKSLVLGHFRGAEEVDLRLTLRPTLDRVQAWGDVHKVGFVLRVMCQRLLCFACSLCVKSIIVPPCRLTALSAPDPEVLLLLRLGVVRGHHGHAIVATVYTFPYSVTTTVLVQASSPCQASQP